MRLRWLLGSLLAVILIMSSVSIVFESHRARFHSDGEYSQWFRIGLSDGLLFLGEFDSRYDGRFFALSKPVFPMRFPNYGGWMGEWKASVPIWEVILLLFLVLLIGIKARGKGSARARSNRSSESVRDK